MRSHTITLQGGPADLRVPADVLVELLGALQDGAMRAARFAVEGESVRKGPKPAWLDAIGRFEITGPTQGSAILQVEAPTLGEAVPERFGDAAEVALFAEPGRTLDARHSALDLFGTVLRSALVGDRDSVLADRPLLESCVRLARIRLGAYSAISLGGIAGTTEPLVVSASAVERMELLRDETPPPRAVRVTGTLDTISVTRTDVILRLGDGTTVSARVERHDPEVLRGLFAKRVVVAGLAQYRPSGRLLVLDAEYIGLAREGDALWEQLPTPRSSASAAVARLLPQDQSGGVAAFFGTWPGDESDEELLAAFSGMR
ncbi:MAG: hypothetical protein JW751_24205 [Polyangiaceae bacterium]|nr:hypothetical protein [Polyangiaceae bacterium]